MLKPISVCMLSALLIMACGGSSQKSITETADLIIHNAKVAVMDQNRSTHEAIAIRNGLVMSTGNSEEILTLKGEQTQVIDVKGRTIIPGLNDSHLHLTRGGRFYNAEVRWDGVSSLKKALQMLKEQAERTPEGQWVRVIGG